MKLSSKTKQETVKKFISARWICRKYVSSDCQDLAYSDIFSDWELQGGSSMRRSRSRTWWFPWARVKRVRSPSKPKRVSLCELEPDLASLRRDSSWTLFAVSGFFSLDLKSGVGPIPSFGFVPLLLIQVNSDWSAGSRLDRRLAVDGPLGPIKLMVTRAGNSLRSVCRKPARASRRPKLFSCLTWQRCSKDRATWLVSCSSSCVYLLGFHWFRG